MAKKIVDLQTPTIPLTGGELIEMEQGNVSVKVTSDQFKSFIDSITYNSTSIRFQAIVDGWEFYSGAGKRAEIRYFDDTWFFIMTEDGQPIKFEGRAFNSAVRNLIAMNPDSDIILYHDGVDHFRTTDDGAQVRGALELLERSSDPTEPTEGRAVIWMSDGTGKGNDGDVMIASKAGGTTRYSTLFVHASGAAW